MALTDNLTSPQTQIYYLRAKYGLSPEDWQEMYEEQKGRCAICPNRIRNMFEPNSPGRIPTVDHDHKTGKVRKLLCSQCNTGLGMFEDSIRLLAGAIVYLQDHEETKL